MIMGNIVCRMLCGRRKTGALGALQAISKWISLGIVAALFFIVVTFFLMAALSPPPPWPKLMEEIPALIISLVVSVTTTVYLFIYCVRATNKYETLFSYSVSDESIAASVPGLKLTYSRKENAVLIEKGSEGPIRVCRSKFNVEHSENTKDTFVSFPGTAVVSGPVVTILTPPTSGYVPTTTGYEVYVSATLGPVTNVLGGVIERDKRELTPPAEYGDGRFFDLLVTKSPVLCEKFSDVLLRFKADTEKLSSDWLRRNLGYVQHGH